MTLRELREEIEEILRMNPEIAEEDVLISLGDEDSEGDEFEDAYHLWSLEVESTEDGNYVPVLTVE